MNRLTCPVSVLSLSACVAACAALCIPSQANPAKSKAEATGIRYTVGSPRDISSGLTSGKRQHGPTGIIKETGPASPQLLDSHFNSAVKTPASKHKES